LALDPRDLDEDAVGTLQLDDRLGRPEGVDALLQDGAGGDHRLTVNRPTPRRRRLQQHLQAALQIEALHRPEVQDEIACAQGQPRCRRTRQNEPGGHDRDQANERRLQPLAAVHTAPSCSLEATIGRRAEAHLRRA
jgi:hypothetical protein